MAINTHYFATAPKVGYEEDFRRFEELKPSLRKKLNERIAFFIGLSDNIQAAYCSIVKHKSACSVLRQVKLFSLKKEEDEPLNEERVSEAIASVFHRDLQRLGRHLFEHKGYQCAHLHIQLFNQYLDTQTLIFEHCSFSVDKLFHNLKANVEIFEQLSLLYDAKKKVREWKIDEKNKDKLIDVKIGKENRIITKRAYRQYRILQLDREFVLTYAEAFSLDPIINHVMTQVKVLAWRYEEKRCEINEPDGGVA